MPPAPTSERAKSRRAASISFGRTSCPPNLTTRLEAYLRADGADVTVEWHNGGQIGSRLPAVIRMRRPAR
ncbi:hypothetical protein EOA46_31085, partial [Mesorhizobium sp. M1A.F.Ca.IN.022.05.2.1]